MKKLILSFVASLTALASLTAQTVDVDKVHAKQQLSLGSGGGRVTVTSIVTLIDGSSTHSQLGSALAMYNAIQAKTVTRDTTLTGNGTSGSPLGLNQQGATSGQVLKYNGTRWAPASDVGTNVTAGAGITLLGSPPNITVTNTGDLSATNEAQTLSAGGTTSPTITLNQILGTGGGTITFVGAGNTTLSRTSNTITITTTGDPDASDDLTTSTNFAGDVTGLWNALTVARIRGVNVSTTAPTTNQVLKYDGTNWAPAADAGITGNQTITLSGDVTGSGATAITATVARIRGVNVSATAPTTGQVLKYNGTDWVPDTDATGGGGGGGISSLNALTAATQTFATGTSGTDFNISSATSTHTFNLPTASATNRGALSSADWTTFNNSIDGSGTAGQVAYFSSGSAIASSSNFTWNNSTAKAGFGVSPGNPFVDIFTGVGDGTINESAGIRLRHSKTDGNSFVMQLGVSNVGAGGQNQGYGYMQTGLWGGSYDNPLFLEPKGGKVGVGFDGTTGRATWPLTVGGDFATRAASLGNNNALVARHGFAATGNGSVMPAYVAGVFDKSFWFQGFGLVFATISGSDISGSEGTERMRISSDGDVGIGVTAPAAKFDVQSAGNTSGTNATRIRNSTGTVLEVIRNDGGVQIPGSVNTATTIMGRDGSGWISNVTLGATLALTSGTLGLAQQSATTGQALVWSGTAWAPATVTPTFSAQSANTFLAGPTTGTAATPTWRTLVTSDLPAILWSGITGGDEGVQDAMAAAFAAGTHTGLTITYNDASNLFNFAVENIYRSNGTLTGARTVTLGTNALVFVTSTTTDAAYTGLVSQTYNNSSTTNPYFTGRDQLGSDRFYIIGAGTDNYLRSPNGNIALQANSSGFKTLTWTGAGGLNFPPSTISSPANGTIWVNAGNDVSLQKGGVTRTLANIEDDLHGTGVTVTSGTWTVSGNQRTVQADCTGGSVTLTLGGSMLEGRDYYLPTRNNGAGNTVTFSAASGYQLSVSGNLAYSSTHTAAAQTHYIARRLNTTIFIR